MRLRRIGFVLKGQTFLRAVGTLIRFSNACGIEPVIACYKERPGKQYDALRADSVEDATQGVAGCIKWIDGKDQAPEVFKHFKHYNVEAVVAQDIHWHFPFLVDAFPTFSIGMFFDTLHYAADNVGKKHSVPTKTYFDSLFFSDRFISLIGRPWPIAVFRSPAFDHSLFVDTAAEAAGSVLFLAPPQSSVSASTIGQVNELIDFCYKHGKRFILKDRQKSPWTASDRSRVIAIDYENGFPYSAMMFLMNSSVHITAYGTSAIESNFLGRPAINLPVCLGSAGRNYDIPSYVGTEEIYDNGLCVPSTGNLIDDYHAALVRPYRAPARILTMDDNYSIDILRDVLNTLDR